MNPETLNTGAETQATTTAPAPKLSKIERLRERLIKLSAQYTAVRDELETLEALESIGTGTQVEIKLGRKFADKDTTRIVRALVVGVAESDTGEKLYKVTYGSGFEAELAVINSASIVRIVSPQSA